MSLVRPVSKFSGRSHCRSSFLASSLVRSWPLSCLSIEVVVALSVAGSGKPTLPVQLLNYVATSADAAVAALSVVLIVFSGVIVVVVERLVGLRKALN